MAKQYKDIKDLISDVSQTKKFEEDAKKEISTKSLSKFLFYLRCDHNLTQKELADKIGCSQSRVSKIEGSYDVEITMRDLFDYGKALDLQLELGYRAKTARVVDLINYHFLRIKGYLQRLIGMAEGDPSINDGLTHYLKEDLLGKMIDLMAENIAKLDLAKTKTLQESKEPIHISHPLSDKLSKLESEKGNCISA